MNVCAYTSKIVCSPNSCIDITDKAIVLLRAMLPYVFVLKRKFNTFHRCPERVSKLCLKRTISRYVDDFMASKHIVRRSEQVDFSTTVSAHHIARAKEIIKLKYNRESEKRSELTFFNLYAELAQLHWSLCKL